MKVGRGAMLLLPGEARVIAVGGFGVKIHADAATTGDAFSLIETDETEAGAGPPMHIHRDCAESFYVLEGAYRMLIDAQSFECAPGSFVYVPIGTRHTFQTLVAGSRKLNLYTPAGMVGYFDDLAAGIDAGMTDAELDRIAADYAMDVVGPVPEAYLSDR